MTTVYSDKEKRDAFKARKTMIGVWTAAFAVFMAAEIALLAVHIARVETMLDRSFQTPFMWISIVLAAAFCFASLFFFGTKYRYTKAYCRMYRDMDEGARDSGTATVLETTDERVENYSIKFRFLTVECPPVRRDQRNIRRLLAEENHDLPGLTPGTRFKFVAHANIILSYEILPEAEGGLGADATRQTAGNDNIAAKE